MIKLKKTFALGLSFSFLLAPLTSYASSPILNKSYYSIDKNTGKLKSDGLRHLAQGIDFDSDWHTVSIDGKNVSFKIKGINYNQTASDNTPSTGINRLYSIANGQVLQNSMSSTVVNKKGTILNKKSSGKISTSAGFSIGKFLNFKNKLSKDWNTSITSTNIEEKYETSTVSETYSFYNDLKGKGYNALDFYTMTAYDCYDVDADIIEHSNEAMVSNEGNFTSNSSSIFCGECGKHLKSNEIRTVKVDDREDTIQYLTLAHIKTTSRIGGKDFYHIGYPSDDSVTKYLRSGYSRVVIDGIETIYPTSSNVKNTILQYLKPYEVRFSSPWKASGPFSTTPDPKIQLVVPGSQKIIETNGEKYLLTITDSSMISRDSLPDETLSNLKVSIANGQSVSKEFSTTITKTSSLEKISNVNYNFSVGLSSSLFKILSFEAGYDKNLSGASTTNTSQSVSLSVSGKNNYFFPEEFSSQGNSLIFNSTNDYAEFLITAQATPVNADGTFNTGNTINMSFKYKQPFIKNYSIPKKF